MSDNRTDLPGPNAPNFNQRLRETIQTYLGKQGNPLDRGLTLRDLLENGLVKIKSGFSLKPGSSGSIPLEPGNGLVDAYEPDLTPPPTPTGFAATGAVSHVFVEHDPPLYTQGHGHLRTRLYGKIVNPGDPLPTFADAAEITQFTGTVHAHPSNPATTWRLWIKWETVDGVLSATPAGGTNGLAVTTGQDVSRLLTALTGQITEGQLYQTLQGRIDLIDGPTSLTGSVNARVAGVQAQVNTINAELAQLTQTPAYDAAVTYDAGDMVTYNGGLYKALQTTTGNLPTNTTYWEKIGDYASLADAVSAHAVQLQDHEARIGNTESGLTTEASARQLLAAQVDDNTTGIQSEATARANADSALSSQITTLTASAGAAPGITRLHFWGFDTGLDGWANTYATASNGIVTWTPTVSNSTFIRSLGTSERYLGSKAPVIRARVRRVAGTGAWEGNLYHSTAAHGASSSYRKTISAPSNPDAWNELEWDMSQLTTGGSDYLDNEITALRIDLVSDANTSVWEFDWVTVGTRNVTPQDVALQTEATVRADETGNLFAKYTVKVDVAGHVSGYGLASSSNGSTPLSQFGVRANQFFVAPPAVSQATEPTTGLYKGYVWVDTSVTPNVTKYYTGSAWSTTPQALPFVIQTSATTINGESVPAGVYIDDAYIKNGTITNAKIGDAAIDNAKIANLSASKITAGTIAAGQYIQSTSYTAGSSGWRINGDGSAEFSNATVRGTVYATNGQFWGTLLGGAASAYATGLGFYAGGGTTSNGANYRWRVGNPSGARIQWNGSAVEVYNASNQLTISSGGIDYSKITGTKPPSDADKTSSNTAAGIANQGAFATLDQITSANISTYIASAAIGTAYIANAAITQAKIGTAAVGSAQIADAAITSAKIGTAAITSAKIADAAITNAKIGSAAVDTLELAGQAVTIPLSAYTAGASAAYNVNGITLQTLSISSSGAPIFILATYAWGGDSNNVGVRTIIKRNGVAVYDSGNVPSLSSGGALVSVACRDTPGAGTHTYTLFSQPFADGGSSGGLVVASSRTLLLLETKR